LRRRNAMSGMMPTRCLAPVYYAGCARQDGPGIKSLFS
jgi:hypothetical protein